MGNERTCCSRDECSICIKYDDKQCCIYYYLNRVREVYKYVDIAILGVRSSSSTQSGKH